MSFFLADRPLESGQTFPFAGPEAHHLLSSRRIRPGERFALQDPLGRRFEAEIVSVEQRRAVVRVLGALALPAPPRVRVGLLQAAVKDKAAELILQKATELGVAGLCFFPAQRSTVAHKALAASGALARWERIAWEACKQSDRAAPPVLRVSAHLAGAVAIDLEPGDGSPSTGQDPTRSRAWLLHPEGGRTLGEALAAEPLPRGSRVRLLVGPEGGFTEEEVAAAGQGGFEPVRLEGGILRAETAALAACAVALHGRA
jgi:16S rRNA (uracil1498-N3)-methyltransferase